MLHVFHMLLETTSQRFHVQEVSFSEGDLMGIFPSPVSRNVSGEHFSYLPYALNSSCRGQCLSEAEVSFLLSGLV